MTTTGTMSVVQQLSELLETGDVETFGTHLRDDFVHHRPDTTCTKTEWLADVRAALGPLAGMKVEILHVLADGDHVVMHTRRRLPDAGPEIAVVDILRLDDDGLIAEAWEIIEPVAEANSHLAWWELAPR